MSGYDLIVKDEELKSAGAKFDSFGNLLSDAIGQYKAILENIIMNAILSGDVHDALMLYKEYVDQLATMSDNLGDKLVRIIDGFIKEIEAADSYLYDAGIPNTVRDFTEEQYQHLKDCLDDPWCNETDSIGDWIYDKVVKVVDYLNWDSAKEFLNKSHRLLLDYNDETKEGLKSLFRDVYNVNSKYGTSIAGASPGDGDYYTCYFSEIIIAMCDIRDILNEMASIINPKGGSFTVDAIKDRLGGKWDEMLQDFEKAMNVPEAGAQPTLPEISDFVSQPWADRYFSNFNYASSMFVNDMGGYEAFKLYVFNLFGVAKDEIIQRVTSGGCSGYEDYITKKQLLAVMGEMAQEYKYSESDEKKTIDECRTFLEYVKKYGENWYEYMNTHRGENGKLLLDGRTKEAKEFNEFLKSIGNADKILKYGSKAIDYMARLFADYKKGLDILGSFKENYADDDAVMKAITDIEGLYNKEFGAWAMQAIEEASEVGYDVAAKSLAKAFPAVAVVETIDKGISVAGDVLGMGNEAKAAMDSLVYYQLNVSSTAAYQNAFEKIQAADPESDEYGALAEDLKNCFDLNKKNLVKMFDSMAKATTGTKKAYYNYCSKQAANLSMRDTTKPDICSYEQFLAINTN